MSSFMIEYQKLQIPLEYIQQATDNFGDSHFLAEGGFGKVYRGELILSNGPTMAAVKRLNPSNNQGDADFWREIMLLSKYKHENIILLLGFCYQSKERILVYEYAPKNSLNNHLHDPKFSWIQRLKICLGAARGLEYLHNPRGGQQRVLHRDIKSANILLDQNWNAKIADFGFSKYGPANQEHSILFSDPKGTLGYCDPVFIETSFYKKESDVYSFGVVLFEVLCSRLCVDYSYDDMRRSLPAFVKNSSKDKIRDAIIDVNLLQQMEENSFDTFITLAHKCLEREQKERPSMELIVKKIETALKYQEQRNAVFANNVNSTSSSTKYEVKEKRDLVTQKEKAGGNEQKEVVFSDNVKSTSLSTAYAVKLEKPDLLPQTEEVGRNQLEENPDDEIKKWSSGKEGNLRALLSTLHEILEPESYWEPVSSTDMIDSDAVRKSYKKAISLIRPKRLTQRRASTREKYICSKVIEMLKVGLVSFKSEERAIKEKQISEEGDQLRILGEQHDDDIKRWSKGRERCLGDLLSNLQYILGPESGWEPVSLPGLWSTADTDEEYHKSLLLTDPDTLNNRGASMKEKYIYGEVRKILKNGWDSAVAEEK
ncbi:unnamed protein product [Lactuca virosa]|uniref:Protein kinase domain-containing protein n=1 Tax=Lactuca virosa TaxID=75947 RepID=A0AAU9PSS7_9ASTR|nr:unnamed protein product [Lactuca virosa]